VFEFFSSPRSRALIANRTQKYTIRAAKRFRKGAGCADAVDVQSGLAGADVLELYRRIDFECNGKSSLFGETTVGDAAVYICVSDEYDVTSEFI